MGAAECGGGGVRERGGTPGATRTPDQLLRRQLLYPLSYGGTISLTYYPRMGYFAIRFHLSHLVKMQLGTWSFIPHDTNIVPHLENSVKTLQVW